MRRQDTEIKARIVAQMAWESACERVRKVIHPPVGYPPTAPKDIDDAFANAAERLHTLRILCTTPGESAGAPPYEV